MPTHPPPLSLIGLEAVIVDLDGVVTDTAEAHFEAWKQTFDALLAERTDSSGGEDFEPFDLADYRRYVDGKPRYEGVASFLESRGIELDWGEPDDAPGFETIYAVGKHKNEHYGRFLAAGKIEVFDDAIDFLDWVREQGLATAVVSSSRNCATVVEQANLGQYFQARVDGNDLAAHGLEGKPAPDMFVEAARRLAVDPQRAMVVEDAVSGVEAGRRGRFGTVVGMARAGGEKALREAGADVVISSFDDLEKFRTGAAMKEDSAGANAIEASDAIVERVGDRRLAVFLDYDGTLSPIVENPADAVLSESMRRAVSELADVTPVAVISGRDLNDVRERVDVEGIAYAGSHGFDILGPEGADLTLEKGEEFVPALDRAEEELRRRLRRIDGAHLERKRYSLAVHYRQVAERDVPTVQKHVDQVLAGISELHKTHGKKVFDLQPDIDWNKGKAVDWLLEELDLGGPDTIPMYIGDDVTDEDAFRALEGRGITVAVQEEPAPTAAEYRLREPDEVEQFLENLAERMAP